MIATIMRGKDKNGHIGYRWCIDCGTAKIYSNCIQDKEKNARIALSCWLRKNMGERAEIIVEDAAELNFYI